MTKKPTRRAIDAAKNMILVRLGLAEAHPSKTGVTIHHQDAIDLAYEELRAEGKPVGAAKR